ncbi:MAG: 4Fe-4S dicluster domain-containing protein [Bacillota bacterium]
MLPVLKQEELDQDFLQEIKGLPGGEEIEACIQCGTCSGSCPSSHMMDYTPRKLILMVMAGMREEVLTSKAPWICASCYSCTVRCPHGVAVTEFMYLLKNLSMKRAPESRDVSSKVFYRSFNKIIENDGRINEMKLMTSYALKTDPTRLVQMAPMGMKMLVKGRMPLVVAGIVNKEGFRRILARARGERA